MLIRRVLATRFCLLVLPALFVLAVHSGTAGAVVQEFDVDETTSTFSTGSIDVNFHSVIHGIGWVPQHAYGTATIDNVMYNADGSVVLDTDASTVTLQDLQIGGDVGATGTGEMVWANIITLDLIYEIVSQSLSLNAPVTVPLVGGNFSATPNFSFDGVSNGHVSGLLIDYGIGEQEFGGDGDMPVDGTLSTAGPNLLLDLAASQMQIDLGGSPTVTIDVYECALWLVGCVFYMTTADVTVTDLTYHDVQMSLAGTSPLASMCGDGVVDVGEDCDDNNTADGDCCSSTCQFEPSGSACNDDGDVCDGTDTCNGAGTCNAGTPLVCDDGNVCTGTETCDPVNGCQAGTPLVCDDGDVCTGTETCNPVSGCQAGTPLVCDDGDVCTGTETCDPVSGCQAGTPLVCDDGSVCTGTETCDPIAGCQAGTPLDCNDHNPCSDDYCSPVIGCSYVYPPYACEDGNACTEGDTCHHGTCEPGPPTDCDDGDDCTADSCDEITGCSHEPIPECTPTTDVPATPSWGPALVAGLLLMASAGLLRERRRSRAWRTAGTRR